MRSVASPSATRFQVGACRQEVLAGQLSPKDPARELAKVAAATGEQGSRSMIPTVIVTVKFSSLVEWI
jgi:hypothetical protein